MTCLLKQLHNIYLFVHLFLHITSFIFVKYLAYVCFKKIWKNELDNFAFKKDKVQDMNISQLKLEIHDTCKKVEKTTSNFKAVNDSDVKNKKNIWMKIYQK